MAPYDEITPEEAAARLGRKPRRVRQLLDNGELEGRRIGPDSRGGRWLVSVASVERLLAQWAADPPKPGRKQVTAPSAQTLAKRKSRQRAAGD